MTVKVGVLTGVDMEYLSFTRQNPNFKCRWLRRVMDLQGETFDFFIRLHRWEHSDSDLLQMVYTQEKLRGMETISPEDVDYLRKRETRFPSSKWTQPQIWPSGGLTGFHADHIIMDYPDALHPNCKSVMIDAIAYELGNFNAKVDIKPILDDDSTKIP